MYVGFLQSRSHLYKVCAYVRTYVYVATYTNKYLSAQAAVSLTFEGTKRRTKEDLHKLLFEDCIEVGTTCTYVYVRILTKP